MTANWVVLVEASGERVTGSVDREDVARLLDALGPSADGSALSSPTRYALQLTTTGPGPAETLSGVLSRWADAVRRLDLPAWEIVRTEVFTPEELERDRQDHHREAMPLPGSWPGSGHDVSGDAGHELLRRAFSDPLTGLLSRESFEHRLEAALSRSGAERPIAVLCVGLDDLSAINDRFGRAGGDELLLGVARRLEATLRPGDDIARVASDEFAVVLDDASEEAAVSVVSRMLEALRQRLTIQGYELSVTASAGVALCTPGETAQTVLGNAHTALTHASQAGGDRHVVFRPAMSRPVVTRRSLRTDALVDRLAHLVLMQEAAIVANEADTLQQAAGVVMRQICEHVGCAIGHLWVSPGHASDASPSLWHVAGTGDDQAFRQMRESPTSVPGAGLVDEVVATGRPGWITDLRADADGARDDQGWAAGLRSAFAFPVVVGHEVVAVVEFFSRTPMDASGPFLDVVASIGTQLGRVVERQRAADALRRSQHRLQVSEARLREAQAIAHLGSWHFDLRSGESS